MIIAGLTGALQGGMVHAGGEIRGKLTGAGIDVRMPKPGCRFARPGYAC